MNRLAPASLGFALAALTIAIVAINVCWTWLLIPCAACTVLAVGAAIAGWSVAARQPERWYGRLWAGGAFFVVFVGFWLTMSIVAQWHSGDRQLRRFAADQLQTIADGMSDHFHTQGRMLPAAITAKDGTPLLSWRVAVLQYLKPPLYARFKLDEPWDSPHNHELLAEMPSFYKAAHRPDVRAPDTVYQVFVGPGTPFDPNAPTPFRPPPTDDPLGLTRQLLIVEASRGVPWTKPEDLLYSANEPLPALGSRRRYALPPTLFVPNPCRWMVAMDVLGPREANLDTIDEETLRQSIAP